MSEYEFAVSFAARLQEKSAWELNIYFVCDGNAPLSTMSLRHLEIEEPSDDMDANSCTRWFPHPQRKHRLGGHGFRNDYLDRLNHIEHASDISDSDQSAPPHTDSEHGAGGDGGGCGDAGSDIGGSNDSEFYRDPYDDVFDEDEWGDGSPDADPDPPPDPEPPPDPVPEPTPPPSPDPVVEPGLIPAPPAPLVPVVAPVPGLRPSHHTSDVMHTPWGTLRYSEAVDKMYAVCDHLDHHEANNACQKERACYQSPVPSRRAQGRPIGFLIAWLMTRQVGTTRWQHVHERNPSFAERQFARAEFSKLPGSQIWLDREKKQVGDPDEPERCP